MLSLHEAARQDDLSQIFSLLRSGAAAVNSTNEHGATALHLACEVGSTRAALILLAFGSDILIQERLHGRTPLHTSFVNQHLEISLALIKWGALSAIPSLDCGKTLHRAVDRVEDNAGNTPMQLLALMLRKRRYSSAGSTALDCYVSGKADFTLGVILPRTKYRVENPRRLELPDNSEAVHLLALPYATAAVTKEGQVYTWGHGRHGRLGHGNTQSYPAPELVRQLSTVQVDYLAGGTNHMLALSRNGGSVFSWGDNEFGQLGHGDTISLGAEKDHFYMKPRRIEFFASKMNSGKGTACLMTVQFIAAGAFHSLCSLNIHNSRDEKGSTTSELYAWGNNEFGQLGIALDVNDSHLNRSISAQATNKTKITSPRMVKFPKERRGDSSRIVSLTAADDVSIAAFEVRRSIQGWLYATVSTSHTERGASSLSGNVADTTIVSKSVEVFQWGRGVFVPFRINVSTGKARSASKVDELNDRNLWSDHNNLSLESMNEGDMSLCTSTEMTALVLSDGNVVLWSVPQCIHKDKRPTMCIPPTQVTQLAPMSLGSGRHVVSATFSQRFLYAVLNTGELLKLRFLLKGSPGTFAVGVVEQVPNLYGVSKIFAAEERLFMLSSVSIPPLPYGAQNIDSLAVTCARDLDLCSESEDSNDEEESNGLPGDAEVINFTNMEVLSLQAMCEQILARSISIKTVGVLISVSKYLFRNELLNFCKDFVSRMLPCHDDHRNLDQILVHGGINDILQLISDIEEEVDCVLCDSDESELDLPHGGPGAVKDSDLLESLKFERDERKLIRSTKKKIRSIEILELQLFGQNVAHLDLDKLLQMHNLNPALVEKLKKKSDLISLLSVLEKTSEKEQTGSLQSETVEEPPLHLARVSAVVKVDSIATSMIKDTLEEDECTSDQSSTYSLAPTLIRGATLTPEYPCRDRKSPSVVWRKKSDSFGITTPAADMVKSNFDFPALNDIATPTLTAKKSGHLNDIMSRNSSLTTSSKKRDSHLAEDSAACNLSDYFTVAITAKESRQKPTAHGWSPETSPSSHEWKQPKIEPQYKAKFAEIQEEEMARFRQTAAYTARKSATTEPILKTGSNNNKTRWFVESRARADSLADVMRVQEELKIDALLEEEEVKAAIEAVERQIMAEKNESKKKNKFTRKGMPRTASI